jgi:tetratricopeptide (TPR) repeat protein
LAAGHIADAKSRDPGLAVDLAKKAVALAPGNGMIQNTLGVAHYRAADLDTAIRELEKPMKLRKGSDSLDWFFLAMAHWRLGHEDKGLKWYQQSVEWLDKNYQSLKPNYKEQLTRFRAEAEEVIGIRTANK